MADSLVDKKSSTSHDPSDEALVAAVVQRDVTAFSLLYDRYGQAVYALAVHMIGRSEAEEIVQEVFLRFWDRADQFDPVRGSFKSWLMSIARYRTLDELRRRNRRWQEVDIEQIERTLATVQDPSVDVEGEVWRRERGRVVLLALQDLPAEQRRVLILAYFGGLSQSSIAKRLDWPLGTVKKRIRLGLQKLRTALMGEKLSATIPDESVVPEEG